MPDIKALSPIFTKMLTKMLTTFKKHSIFNTKQLYIRQFESFTRCQIGIHCTAMDTDFFYVPQSIATIVFYFLKLIYHPSC